MDGYIKKSEAVDVIVKYPYDIAGKTATAIKMIEGLPSAGVVPKSTVESIIYQNSQLEAENERLNVELKVMRGTANSYKMHYEKAMEVQKEVYRLASEIKAELPLARSELAKNVASEIFAEIERIILDNTYPDFNREHKPVNIWKAKTGYDALDELKKKYTEGVKKE